MTVPIRYRNRYTSATRTATKNLALTTCQFLSYRAGDGIRTHDVQLGKTAWKPAEKPGTASPLIVYEKQGPFTRTGECLRKRASNNRILRSNSVVAPYSFRSPARGLSWHTTGTEDSSGLAPPAPTVSASPRSFTGTNRRLPLLRAT